MTPQKEPFIRLLDRFSFPYTVTSPEGAITIRGNLDIQKSDIAALPADLTVRGCLYIGGHHMARLPDRLVVEHSLMMKSTRIEELPADLTVRKNISMVHGKLRALPPGFHVAGSLSITDNPIQELPENLFVGESLDMRATRVTHFPLGLHVGGILSPPNTLHDIHRFMEEQDDVVLLSCTRSMHQKLDMQSRLQEFPDLARVVASMGNTHQLSIARRDDRYMLRLSEIRA